MDYKGKSFEKLASWPKFRFKSGPQWGAVGANLTNHPGPILGCKNGLKCAAMGGLLRSKPQEVNRCMSEGVI